MRAASGVVAAATLLGSVVLAPRTLEAQATERRDGGGLSVVAGNMAIPGLFAGIARAARGGSFWEGLWRGMSGGAVTYLGKRIALEDREGFGLLGREVAAVGTSISRSAAFGSGFLDTLVLPVGPLRLYVEPSRPTRSFLRVDAEEVGWVLYAATSEDYEFRARSSLSAGAFVFTTRTASRTRFDPWKGRAASGLVRLDESYIEETLGHELIHVVQIDQLKILVGLPLEVPIKRGLSMGDSPPWSWIDFGIAHYPFSIASARLMEAEADAFDPVADP